MSISLVWDAADPRIVTDRLAMLVSGRQRTPHGYRLGWDLWSTSSGVMVDAITYTAMLQPVHLHPSWQSSAAAPYERLIKANYALTSASWIEHSYRFNGDTYLHRVGAAEAVTTTETFDANRGFVFSWYSYGLNDGFAQLYVRLGNVGVAFWSDGTTQIYKPVASFADFTSTNLVGTGSIAQLDTTHSLQAGAAQGQGTSLLTGQPIDVMIMPWRTRELLVLSNRGGGFSHVFEDIPKDDDSPVITTAGTMSWYVPSGQATVQAAPLKFATSGYITTEAQTDNLRQPPATGATATAEAFYSLPWYGVTPTITASCVASDGTTPFVGDAATKSARIRVAMTGDGTNTPYLYGAQAVFTQVTADTDDEDAVDLSNYTTALELSVPEQPSGALLRVRIHDVKTVEVLASKFRRVGNRAVILGIDSVTAFGGRAGAPKVIDSPNADCEAVEIEIRDPWVAMERYRIQDPTPFDGRTLQSVIEELCRMHRSATATDDVEDTLFTLPSVGQASLGEWGLIPDAGDTSAEWIERLTDEFARGVIMGWVPTVTGLQFRWLTPEGAGTTPEIVVYDTLADSNAAYQAAGASEAEAAVWQYDSVYRRFEEVTEEPECNEVRVQYWDSRTDTAGEVVHTDTASQTPDTAPILRPDNWQGEPRVEAISDPAITSLAEAQYAAGCVRDRVMVQRRTAEMDATFLFKSDGSPIWRGDIIQVRNKGVYRVESLHGTFVTDARVVRWFPFTYSLVRVAEEPVA